MFYASEIAAIAGTLSLLTALGWLVTNGLPFSLADLTTIRKPSGDGAEANSSNSIGAQKAASHKFVLLPVTASRAPVRGAALSKPAPVSATAPLAPAVPPAAPSPAAVPTPVKVPLDAETQLQFVARALNDSIELADKANRLHTSAQQQLDAAHYALQNLLAELSLVLPVKAPAKESGVQQSAAGRTVYVTALAA